MNSLKIVLFGVVATFFATSVVLADNAEANSEFSTGMEKYKDGSYSSAASSFLAAEIYADDPLIKAKSIQEAVLCYHKANLKYREFINIEKLINGFPTHIDFGGAVDREFAIGDAYFQGYRAPAFESLSFIPWLKGPDKTVEIYEKALEHGPYASRAPEARLRLGRLYLEDDKYDAALTAFRKTASMYSNTKAAKYATLELANALVQLSRYGDGDGAYGKEALSVLDSFIAKYPDDSEIPWAIKAVDEVNDITAKRLYGIASFYKRRDNTKAASRYLSDVVKEYPDSNSIEESEEMLATIEPEYAVSENRHPKKRLQLYKKIYPLPSEPEKILCVPENSDGKWLLPIEDLELGNEEEEESN